jgi:hypothetical protein
MAQIPTTVARRSLDPGNPVQYPTGDPVGAALENAGNRLAVVAEHWQRTQEKDEDLKARLAYDGFRRAAEAKMLELRDNMPEAGTGFLRNVQKAVAEEQKAFLKSVPPRLQETYGGLVQNELVSIQSKAAHFELEANRGFARTEVSKLHNRLMSDIVANPDPASADQVFGFGLKAIEDTRLPADEKARFREAWHQNARSAEAQARWRDDPEGMARALGVPYQRVLDRNQWEQALVQRESSGNPRVVNNQGYAGLYQFGAPRLAAVGFYSPGTGESVNDTAATGGWSGQKWSGTFKVPGFPEVKTVQDFLNSPGAQKAAFGAHLAKMDQEIAERGLEQYIGRTVQGVPITREGIYSMIHLGGAGGAQAALQGRGDAKDANGASVLEYARLAARVVPGGSPDPRYADLPFDQRQRVVAHNDVAQRRLEAEREKQGATAYAEQLNTFQQNIQNGTANYADVQKAKNEGWLTDASDIGKLTAAIEKRDEEVETTRQAMTALQTPGFVWNPFDKTHKEMAEAAFMSLGGNLEGLQTVANKSGMVPPSAAASLRGALVSNQPQRVESALQVANNLMVRNPNIFAGVEGSKDITEAVTTFQHRVGDLGFTATEATRRHIEESKPEYQAQLKVRVKGEDVDKIVREQLDPLDLKKAFNEGLPLLGRPEAEFDPEHRRELMGSYGELVKDYYERNGNVALAKKQAIAQLKRVWGVTNVTGKAVITKYPPERAPAYAGIENAADLIATDAIASIKAVTGTEPKRENLRFYAFRTGETARAYQNGEPVPYLLAWTDSNGAFQMMQPTTKAAFVADPEAMRRTVVQTRRSRFDAALEQLQPGFERADRYRETRRRVNEEARQRIQATRAEVEGTDLVEITSPDRFTERDEQGRPAMVSAGKRRVKLLRDATGRIEGFEEE